MQAVLQPGYRTWDRVLRAARVAVVDPEADILGAVTAGGTSATGRAGGSRQGCGTDEGGPVTGQDWFEKDFYGVLGVPKDADPADQEGLPQARALDAPGPQPG